MSGFSKKPKTVNVDEAEKALVERLHAEKERQEERALDRLVHDSSADAVGPTITAGMIREAYEYLKRTSVPPMTASLPVYTIPPPSGGYGVGMPSPVSPNEMLWRPTPIHSMPPECVEGHCRCIFMTESDMLMAADVLTVKHNGVYAKRMINMMASMVSPFDMFNEMIRDSLHFLHMKEGDDAWAHGEECEAVSAYGPVEDAATRLLRDAQLAEISWYD